MRRFLLSFSLVVLTNLKLKVLAVMSGCVFEMDRITIQTLTIACFEKVVLVVLSNSESHCTVGSGFDVIGKRVFHRPESF